MRTRTLLTTPPGDTPEPELGRSRSTRERYSPGLALPEEPEVPARHRRALVVAATVLGLTAVGTAIVQAGIGQQAQDPALTQLPDG